MALEKAKQIAELVRAIDSLDETIAGLARQLGNGAQIVRMSADLVSGVTVRAEANLSAGESQMILGAVKQICDTKRGVLVAQLDALVT